MTIAISVKVHDGVVLATDSAASMGVTFPGGVHHIVNVYNNANKIYNLRKGLPIGAMVWGAGSIGASSQATLAKDLRAIFSQGHPDPAFAGWQINPNNYSVQQVAERTRDFLLRAIQAAHPSQPAQPAQPGQPAPAAQPAPSFGTLIAGFSFGADLAEMWLIEFVNGQVQQFRQTIPADQVGIDSYAQDESVIRLLRGHGTGLAAVLQQLTNNPQLVHGWMHAIEAHLSAAIVHPAMPIQDAIDMADWLVYNAVMYSRFLPGPPTVGGPIEVAAITKHEGFKWIKRKHYFDPRLNPAQ